MIERIGRKWAVTEFIYIPYGECFRYNKEWCVRFGTYEFTSCCTAKVNKMDSLRNLVAIEIKRLGQFKRNELIEKERNQKFNKHSVQVQKLLMDLYVRND